MLELSLKNIGVSFGSRMILKDVSATLHEGEIVSVIGQNAAGKTVLLKSIAGLIAHQGSVHLRDGDQELPISRISYLPQLSQTVSRLSVFEMVLLGLGKSLGWRVTQDVFDRVDRTLHAMHINTLAHQPVDSLSGGQKQLVFMAQAFVSEPRVLLLDEPTSALDLRHQLIVMQAAQEYTRRMHAITLIVVHDLLLAARFSSRLLMISEGHVTDFAEPEQVLQPENISSVYHVSVSVEKTKPGYLAVVPMEPLEDPRE